ncbi:hypothetical protein Q6346_11530 [Isoptericola sp. b490]|uniref:hypothetical protein n=1 Tax=Actinotalea lenta TaxID=3064654 RepID=UPI002713D452|nr:hypothetical protein [Isoptericola sp. b490]MDO8121941.1 hypothetical protein [Isoptericola sp. b490]
MRTHERPSLALSLATVALALATVATLVAVGWLVAGAMSAAGSSVTWMLGRAGGVASYVLLVALVVTGLLQAHPWSRHWHRPSPRTRLTVHVSLATFTLVFTALHVVVLVLDPWAHVGWRGALVPLASGYRPVAVTLGVTAVWAGLVTGLTAVLAGRVAARVWWPIHKVAVVTLGLVWVHSVLAGSDAVALRGFYLATGAAVIALAVTRYAARTPADRVAELTEDLAESRRGLRPPSLRTDAYTRLGGHR